MDFSTQQLRQQILSLAIQGKLVPQIAAEGNAQDLLKQIEEEKAKLIKEGKLKKSKPLPEITDEEKPFEIPESWVWCRLRDVGLTNTGTTPSKTNPQFYGQYIPFVSPGDIQENRLNYRKDGLSKEGYNVARPTPSGTILQVCIGGSIGKLAITDREVTFNQQINSLTPYFVDSKYLFAVMGSQYFYVQITKDTAGSATPIINKSSWENTIIPLPPLSEQKRIVEKLEVLLGELDTIEQTKEQIEHYAEQLQGQILQTAIQGKLVPQIASEGNAQDLLQKIEAERKKSNPKYKPLPPVTDEEKPFEIPESWEWVRLGMVCNVKGGKRIPAGKKLTKEDTGYKYIRVTDMKNWTVLDTDVHYITKDIYEKIKAYTISTKDVYITVAGTIGQSGTIPDFFNNANLTENADKLEIFDNDKQFIVYMLNSPFIQKQIKDSTTKVGQPKLAIKRIEDLVVALPPLAEQKRIVAKLEELLGEVEKLKR